MIKIPGYDSLEAYARMNYLVDVVRGNVPSLPWSSLSNDMRAMYVEEAGIAEYVITEADMDNIESFIGVKNEIVS
jgi:hypothetical protein